MFQNRKTNLDFHPEPNKLRANHYLCSCLMRSLVLLFMIALGTPALAAPCEFLHDPSPKPMSTIGSAPNANVLVELWIDEPDEMSLGEVLAVFETRNIPITLVLSLPTDGTEKERLAWAALADRAQAHGHHIALRIQEEKLKGWDATPVSITALAPLRSARKQARLLLGTTPVTAAVSLPDTNAEAILMKSGFRILLEYGGASVSSPRLSSYFPNQLGSGVIVPRGPYMDTCHQPFQWGSANSSRVTESIQRLAGQEKQGVIRLPLRQQQPNLSLLTRWLEKVLVPSGSQNVLASALHTTRWRRALHQGTTPAHPMTKPAPMAAQRLIPISYVKQVAEVLANTANLPAVLPQDLNLSEAFVAFIAVLGSTDSLEVVALSPIQGPEKLAVSQLGNHEFTTTDSSIKTLAKQLDTHTPQTVPSSMRIDGQMVSAAELLVLLAQTILGETNPSTGLVRVPDPHASTLGWGNSVP